MRKVNRDEQEYMTRAARGEFIGKLIKIPSSTRPSNPDIGGTLWWDCAIEEFQGIVKDEGLEHNSIA